VVAAVVAALVATVLWLGHQQASRMRELALGQFNAQQLVLARYAAAMIGQDWDFLRRELVSLSRSQAMRQPQEGRWRERLEVALAAVEGRGVVRIERLSGCGGASLSIAAGGTPVAGHTEPVPELCAWLAEGKAGSRRLHLGPAGGGERLIRLSTPLTLADGRPVGVLSFIIDRLALAALYSGQVKSGRSGYAWVIDSGGYFLAHREAGFVGQNAAQVRMRRAPGVSFEKINRIQRELMAAGNEGCTSYTSGWHAGVVGRVQKLIAYSPVRLAADNRTELWSVAVVAPVSEAEEAVSGLWRTSVLIQALVIGLILLGGVYILASERRWSRYLAGEVARRTENLSRSEERYRSLIENAEDIIFTLDEAGRYRSMNRCGARFLGCPEPGRCLGLYLEEHFSAESAEGLRRLMSEALGRPEGVKARLALEVGGRPHWFSIHLKALESEGGRAVLGILRDITEHMRDEELMYRTEKLASIGVLAAGVAHEINNPLGAIMGFSQLLLKKAPPGSQEESDLRIIHEQGERCKKIVEGLLQFGRLADSGPAAAARTDLNHDIEIALAVASGAVGKKKIKVEKDLDPRLPLVAADSGEMQQVLLNLINNAVAAMSEGGQLRLSTFCEGQGLVSVQVADNGCGIPEELRQRVYDPFFTTKRVGEGTGLGLSVSYGIVTKYGGTIDFESRTRDVWGRSGTTFTIRMAAEPKESSAGPGEVANG
jgi:PAS domain S-box-containing protein